MIEQAGYWVAALFLSAGALIVSALGYVRTGNWKRSDAGKQVDDVISRLDQRISTMETRLDGVPTKLSSINDRMTTVEALLKHMPTSADIAGISAELDAVQDDVKLVRQGVTRIEDILLAASTSNHK